MILIVGGKDDPNITGLVRRAATRGVPYLALLVGAEPGPNIDWDIVQDRLEINGSVVQPRAVFLRYDIFMNLRDGRPESQRRAARWHETVLSWVLAHEEVAFFNRRYGTRRITKPSLLHLAKSVGIAIPQTTVTNDTERLDRSRADQWIVKPVNGGEYTRVLADAYADQAWLGQFSSEPTIVQQRLDAPDLRIYRVGDHWFGFTLESEAIDYRIDNKVRIRPARATMDLVVPLARLMNHLGLDFGAADYKRSSETGEFLFLEVNSAAMFTSFDRVLGGAISERMIEWLTPHPGALERRGGLAPNRRFPKTFLDNYLANSLPHL